MESRTAEMQELLVDLVAAESPTPDAEAQAGPQRLLREAYEAFGYEVRHLRGDDGVDGGQLLARPARARRAPRYQLLVGHSDTVWDRGTLRTMPIEIRNRRMYGPGTFDMKAGLVQMLYAIRAVTELGWEPEVTPVAWINSDEEIGSPFSDRRTAHLAGRADRALIIEPASGPDGRIKTGRKGNGSYEAVVRGKEAHAGLEPEAGAHAILAAAGLVERLQALNDLEKGMTVNVGVIEGGTRPNVIPAECRFTIDFRAETCEDLDRLVTAIEAMRPDVAGTTIELDGGIERAPLERTPRNRRLWEAVRRSGSALGLDLDEVFVGGGSDGNITSVYTPTVDGLGPVGGGAHARDEHVELDSLPERAALLALVLMEPPLGD